MKYLPVVSIVQCNGTVLDNKNENWREAGELYSKAKKPVLLLFALLPKTRILKKAGLP